MRWRGGVEGLLWWSVDTCWTRAKSVLPRLQRGDEAGHFWSNYNWKFLFLGTYVKYLKEKAAWEADS